MKRLFVVLVSLSVVLGVGVPVLGQGAVEVREAELAVPFGVAPGKLVLVGDQLVFVDDGQLDASFSIPRGNITTFEAEGNVLRIVTTTPVADRTGRRSELRVRVSDAAPMLRWYRTSGARAPAVAARTQAEAGPSGAAGTEPLVYQARHDHRIGSCEGRLVITDTRLAYESTDDIGDSRQWVYEDIREVSQDGVYRLRVTPFVGNSYSLELLGAGLDSAQYRRIVDRIAAARVVR